MDLEFSDPAVVSVQQLPPNGEQQQQQQQQNTAVYDVSYLLHCLILL